MIGIASYGSYIPRFRIKAEEIAKVWGKEPNSVIRSLGVREKSVAGADEDSVTMAYESARSALSQIDLAPEKIGSIFVGSESHPYAVNATSTIVGEFLGVGNDYFASDMEFACKAPTTAMITTAGLLESNKETYGLVIGSDCAQAKPHDVLEYTAASGSASLILSNRKVKVAAEIVDYLSFSSDTPDFWRRDGISYPSHGGRFTGEPSYFHHVLHAAQSILSRNKLTPADFDHVVFHCPNGKFPRMAAKRLGFTNSKLKHSLVVDHIGNAYTAMSLLGLINVLDHAKPNQRILLVSYGSGASSDAFIFQTTKQLRVLHKNKSTLQKQIANKTYMSYTSYLKAREAI